MRARCDRDAVVFFREVDPGIVFTRKAVLSRRDRDPGVFPQRFALRFVFARDAMTVRHDGDRAARLVRADGPL